MTKAIRTKYVGPTNSRGGRLIADDGDGNRTVVPYAHRLSPHENHRVAFLVLSEKMQWPVAKAQYGYFKNQCYWTTPEFRVQS